MAVGRAGLLDDDDLVLEVESTREPAERRHDEVLHERRDNRAERRADDHADRKVDDVPLHRELAKFGKNFHVVNPIAACC
jgi:hypothetical protein